MNLEMRRKRLRFRAWHRGTKENDLLLGRFADAHLAEMDAAELDRFEALLSAPDQDIYNWISGRSPAPTQFDTPLLNQITHYSAGIGQGS